MLGFTRENHLEGRYQAMLEKKALIVIIMAVFTAAGAGAQTPPDRFTVAGGFTPIPLMIKVGEQFVSKAPQYKPPQILYNDTTTGFKLFCAGAGPETPSINTGTRNVRPAELELCDKNGVNEIVRINLGRDALVAAQAAGGRLSSLSRKELFLAVAKDVPDPKDNAKLIANPYKSWKDINPALPDLKIQILAPESGIGLHQTYITSIVSPGCRQIDAFKLLETSNPKDFEAVCKSFRKDDAYNEYTRTPSAIQELKNKPDILGIVALTMVLRDNLVTLSLDKMEPTLINVSRNTYGLTFPMFVFIKKSHVGLIPGLKEYLAELTSDAAMGTTGYFYDMGVIPLPLVERKQMRADVETLKVLSK